MGGGPHLRSFAPVPNSRALLGQLIDGGAKEGGPSHHASCTVYGGCWTCAARLFHMLLSMYRS